MGPFVNIYCTPDINLMSFEAKRLYTHCLSTDGILISR